MSDKISKDNLPTSFGAFNPVGHLMVGVPGPAQASALADALCAAGWPRDAVMHFTPRESIAEFEEMTQNPSMLAGFGYEITLLRRYLALAREGCRWLLVKVDDTDHAARAADIARAHGATLAVHYRSLVVEELI
ncbi:MAG: hypothetical protein AD742_14645 [Methylibium sp. NZG]|nr:MAG: hypothetical protein AD742_14645 [Methylibium sp. NZG]